MTDKLCDMMVGIYQMTKGELVDIICKLMDDIDRVTLDAANERDKAREELERETQASETYQASACKWKEEYQKLWDLVELGATIYGGKLVFDKQVKLKYIERLLMYGEPVYPVQRQLGIDLAKDITDDELRVAYEVKADELRKKLKAVGIPEAERAKLLKEMTDLIRRKHNA